MNGRILLITALIGAIIYLFVAEIITMHDLKKIGNSLSDALSFLDPIFEDILKKTSETTNDVLKDARDDVKNIE